MSQREKNLLFFFAFTGFIILNFLAFRYAINQKGEVNLKRRAAEQQLEDAERFRASSEEIQEEMAWLDEHEPTSAAPQEVQTKLQSFVESEAKTAGLNIKTQKPLPTQAGEGKYYHRAKLLITVSGNEQALYRWLGRVNIPDQFRIATQIRLSPNAQDDTQIDCTATVEEWFVPPTT